MKNYQRFQDCPTLYAGTSKLSVSEAPPDGLNRDKDREGNDTVLALHMDRQTEILEASWTRYLLRVVMVLVVTSVTIVPKSSLSDST